MPGLFDDLIEPPAKLPSMAGRTPAFNSDGSVSTVRSIGVGDERGEWVIPTVVDGRIVGNDEAVSLWRSGKNKAVGGPFKTVDESNAFAQSLHESEAERIKRPAAMFADLIPAPSPDDWQKVRPASGPSAFEDLVPPKPTTLPPSPTVELPVRTRNDRTAGTDLAAINRAVQENTPGGVKAFGQMLSQLGNQVRAVPADAVAMVAGHPAAGGNFDAALGQKLFAMPGEPAPERKLPVDAAIEQAAAEEKEQGKFPLASTAASASTAVFKTAPKLALLPALAGEGLFGQAVASGGLFGLDEQGRFSPKEGLIMAALPGVGAAAKHAAGAVLGEAIASGATALENPLAQKILEEISHQAGLNAFMTVSALPEFMQMSPEERQKALAEQVGTNLAFSLLGARDWRRTVPSQTQKFIEANAERFSQDTLKRMVTRELTNQINGEGRTDLPQSETPAQPILQQTVADGRQLNPFSDLIPKSPEARAEVPAATDTKPPEAPISAPSPPTNPAEAEKPLTRADLPDLVQQLAAALRGESQDSQRLKPGTETVPEKPLEKPAGAEQIKADEPPADTSLEPAHGPIPSGRESTPAQPVDAAVQPPARPVPEVPVTRETAPQSAPASETDISGRQQPDALIRRINIPARGDQAEADLPVSIRSIRTARPAPDRDKLALRPPATAMDREAALAKLHKAVTEELGPNHGFNLVHKDRWHNFPEPERGQSIPDSGLSPDESRRIVRILNHYHGFPESDYADATAKAFELARVSTKHGFNADAVERWMDHNGLEIQGMYNGDTKRVTLNAAARHIQSGKDLRQTIREERAHQMLDTPVGRKKVYEFARDHLTNAEIEKLRKQGYSGGRNLFADEFIAKQAANGSPLWQRLVDLVRGWMSKHGLARLTPAETARAILRSLHHEHESSATPPEGEPPAEEQGGTRRRFSLAEPDQTEIERLRTRRDELQKEAEKSGDYAPVQAINTEMDRLMKDRQPRDMPLNELHERANVIARRLEEIGQQTATKRKTLENLPPELRSERYALAKEQRAISRELFNRPETVADLLREQDRLLKQFKAARDAKDSTKAQALYDQLNGLTEGDLGRVNPQLYERVRKELEAKGEIEPMPNNELPAGRTLGDLTSWLRENKLDSPKLSLFKRLNLARTLAETFDTGRTIINRAVNKVQATWQAFKEQYKAPPIDTDFRGVLKNWNLERTWTGVDTRNFQKEVRAQISDPERREAISVWLDAGGDTDLLRAQALEVPEKYRKIWERALTLTSREQGLARRIEQDFGSMLQDGLNLGLIEKGREAYGVPQRWKELPKRAEEHNFSDLSLTKPASPRNPAAKLDPRAPFFSLQRTFDSYFDGIMAGGKPESLDIAHLVGLYHSDFQNSLADRSFIWGLKEAKAEDGMPVVMISGNAKTEQLPGGGTRYLVDSSQRPKEAVTKDGEPYRAVDHWALKGWKYASRDAEGNPILVSGDFLVHPDAYEHLKRILVPKGLSEVPVVSQTLKVNRFLKASKLSLAPFHMSTEALHAVFHLTNPYNGKFQIDLKNPTQKLLVRHGLDLGMNESHSQFSEGVGSHGGIYAYVPGLNKVLAKFGDYLFKEYIPRLKMRAALKMLGRNESRYGDKLTPEQIHELTASQANAAFGAQNYALMGRSPVLRDILSLTFLAPDFLESRTRFVAQAFKPHGGEQRMALALMAASVYVGARLMNTVLDDNHDAHWDLADAFAVYHGGRRYSLRTVVQDTWHAMFEKRSFIFNRLSAFARSATEFVTQRDWRGIKRDNLEQIEDFFSWLVPAGAEGMIPGTRKANEQSFASAALGSMGVGSRKASAYGEMHELAADFNRKSKDPAARRQQGYSDKVSHPESNYRDLDNALDNKDIPTAKKEYKKLLALGFDPDHIAERYKAFTDEGEVRHPFTGSTDREPAFIKTLTTAQKQAYAQAIKERRMREAAFDRVVSR